MALNLTKIADAIVEPVTLELAHAQCRVDPSFILDDALLTLYISSARQTVEKIMKRAIFNQTWLRTIDGFPVCASFDSVPSIADKWNWPGYSSLQNRLAIDLPMGRALVINSIEYFDGGSTPVALNPSLYIADLSGIPCRVMPSGAPAGALAWPFLGIYQPGAVAIQWQAGSFVTSYADSLAVASTGGGSPVFTVTLSVTAALGAGKTLLTTPVTLVDADDNPVPFTIEGGVLALPGSYTAGTETLNITANQVLKATYYSGNCPADIQHAILWLVAHYYRNGEAATDLTLRELPQGVQAKLSPHIVEWSDYRPC
jgi:hypothetical protein